MTTVNSTRPTVPVNTASNTTAAAPTQSKYGAVIQAAANAPSAAAQSAVNDALAQLKNTNGIITDSKGNPVPLSYCFSQGQISEAQGRYTQQLQALLNHNPPLTDAQIKDQAGKLVDKFKTEFAFQKGMIDIFFRRSMMMMSQLMSRIMQGLSGG